MKAIDEISRWTKLNIKALTFYANEYSDDIPPEIKSSEAYQSLFEKSVIDQEEFTAISSSGVTRNLIRQDPACLGG